MFAAKVKTLLKVPILQTKALVLHTTSRSSFLLTHPMRQWVLT